jgi:hypothetical protein
MNCGEGCWDIATSYPEEETVFSDPLAGGAEIDGLQSSVCSA